MRNVEERILILCEDEKSSKDYFDNFKKDEKLKRLLPNYETKHAKHFNNPMKFVEEAIARQENETRASNEYTEVWLVFDKDNHSHESLAKAQKLADDAGFQIILSSICFEVWLILHFERTNKIFPKPNEALKHLKLHLKEYAKNNNKCFSALPDLWTAVENAEWLVKENKKNYPKYKKHQYGSHTDIHILVQRLLEKVP